MLEDTTIIIPYRVLCPRLVPCAPSQWGNNRKNFKINDRTVQEMETNSLNDRVAVDTENASDYAGELEQVASPIELPKETLEFFNADELRARVFYEKYALKDMNGMVVEQTPIDMWARVARELASVEITQEKRNEWTKKFYWLLENFRFVPGGRIMFGAGQPRRSTLLNCYYLPIRSDSLEDIFDFCKEAGRTYSYGGGVGTDISILRPKGAPVNNSAVVSTGSVSFMELFSITTGTIGQAGRRGALMITIHVDNPDVVDFIDVKRDLSRVNHANISVCITDKFMQAIEQDDNFALSFKNDKADIKRVVKARVLCDKLVRSAWASAEPGIIFWDNVKNESPTEYNGMEVHGFNPCSEQCLEDYGCCCLGNINLSQFVVDEFSERARLDWRNMEKALRYSTRFLDNVLDYNSDKHPLSEQKKASMWSRRIGVGFTGLADMLIKLNMKYDSPHSIKFIDRMFDRVKNICYDESCNIAVEKGSAPAFVAEKHLARPFIQRLDNQVKQKISAHGIRNCCVLTVPPVGSGAIIAGTTSGIEPIFALSYIRKSKSLSGGEFKVYHPLVQDYMKRFGLRRESELPDIFVTAHSIKAEFRVQMQGTIQKHVDSSISSTVNIPKEATVQDVKDIYFQAWRAGCKGITVYREGAREGILLTNEEAAIQKGAGAKSQKFERPKVLTGRTVKMKLPQGSLYVTANKNGDDIIRETFVTLGKSGGDEKADAEAIGRLISLYLQHGGKLNEVIQTLKGIQGRDVSWDNGQQLLSVPDAVAKALASLTGTTVEKEQELKHCPDCGEASIIFENGCYRCASCGYSKCN